MKKPKSLYAELAEDARARRVADAKKKYSTGSDTLDAVSASQDEAADAITMPEVDTIEAGVAGVAKDADTWAEENRAALASLEEDEEDAKWMAKQKG